MSGHKLSEGINDGWKKGRMMGNGGYDNSHSGLKKTASAFVPKSRRGGNSHDPYNTGYQPVSYNHASFYNSSNKGMNESYNQPMNKSTVDDGKVPNDAIISDQRYNGKLKFFDEG
jgi:hypothetical protein